MFGKLGQGEDFADTLAATKGSNFDVIYDLYTLLRFYFLNLRPVFYLNP